MKQYNSWQSYKRLLMFIKPYKMRLVVAVICMALSGASNVVVPWLIKDVIDKVLAAKPCIVTCRPCPCRTSTSTRRAIS